MIVGRAIQRIETDEAPPILFNNGLNEPRRVDSLVREHSPKILPPIMIPQQQRRRQPGRSKEFPDAPVRRLIPQMREVPRNDQAAGILVIVPGRWSRIIIVLARARDLLGISAGQKKD